MSRFQELSRGLEWRAGDQVLRVEEWGPGSVRVRAGVGRLMDLPDALLPADASLAEAGITLAPPRQTVDDVADGTTGFQAAKDATAVLSTGGLRVEVNTAGMIRFCRADGSELLSERRTHFAWPGARHFDAIGQGRYRISQRFKAYPGERLYGLGQQQHGLLDQKGAVIDLVQRNGDVSIPFVLSNRGYGFLWNSPAVGRVELAKSGTRWVSDAARQIDYWFTVGASPAHVLANYADATGHSPMMPEWATGFWQSKLRYRSQQELLDVAREYKRRGLTVSVIVADFFHWTGLGDWKFDKNDWPDPQAMVNELAAMGTKLMVSVWPSVNPLSSNWAEMSDRGLLIGTEFGPVANTTWFDKPAGEPAPVAFYDATNPEARRFIWEAIEHNYGRYGIDVFWLDACEPEILPLQPGNLRFWAGDGAEVANLYPREHARAFWEGRNAAGRHGGLTFARSAWAGSQRYGAALWSGDIGVDFATLRRQVAAGLNAGISGIPWWCSDIGGFHGGDPDDPAYREVLVRWFQFGAFSPIFRMHGDRAPRMSLGPDMTGGPNEIWSYGPEVESILVDYMHLRERIRPYLQQQMVTAAESGMPPMRALFLEFPDDQQSWGIADQYLLGPDLLVAPILRPRAVERDVYLPAGAQWTDAWTGTTHRGGRNVNTPAPLDRIPLFLRNGSVLPILSQVGQIA